MEVLSAFDAACVALILCPLADGEIPHRVMFREALQRVRDLACVALRMVPGSLGPNSTGVEQREVKDVVHRCAMEAWSRADLLAPQLALRRNNPATGHNREALETLCEFYRDLLDGSITSIEVKESDGLPLEFQRDLERAVCTFLPAHTSPTVHAARSMLAIYREGDTMVSDGTTERFEALIGVGLAFRQRHPRSALAQIAVFVDAVWRVAWEPATLADCIARNEFPSFVNTCKAYLGKVDIHTHPKVLAQKALGALGHDVGTLTVNYRKRRSRSEATRKGAKRHRG